MFDRVLVTWCPFMDMFLLRFNLFYAAVMFSFCVFSFVVYPKINKGFNDLFTHSFIVPLFLKCVTIRELCNHSGWPYLPMSLPKRLFYLDLNFLGQHCHFIWKKKVANILKRREFCDSIQFFSYVMYSCLLYFTGSECSV